MDDLLKNIFDQLRSANALVDDLESTIRPVEKELNELRGKIKNMEHVEEISQQVQQLKKKLAWSWVYDVDKQLQEQSAKIGKLQDRIPICRAKIDHQLVSNVKYWLCYTSLFPRTHVELNIGKFSDVLCDPLLSLLFGAVEYLLDSIYSFSFISGTVDT